MSVDKMPEGWESRKLAEVCRLWNGRAYKKEELLEEGKYLVLRVGNFFTNDRWYYSNLELEDEKYCNDGDLLYAWSASFGPRIWAGDKTIFHYHIWKITVDEHLIDKNFLFYFLEWDAEQIKRNMGSGSTMIHVTKGAMEQRDIILPPLDEQRRIAEVLRSVDEAIAANRVAVDAARRTLEALAAEIVAEAPDTRAVADFGTVVTGGTPSPKNANLWDGDLPFVTPGDLDDECISVRDAARSLNASAPHRARVLPANSVLVTCIGSTVGKVAISRRECATNQQINAICCDPALAGYVYLACLAAYDEIVANAGKQAVPIINKSTFSGLSLPYFPRERMLEISEAVDALDDERERSVAALDRLTSTKTSMMTDLLSGRVRVPA